MPRDNVFIAGGSTEERVGFSTAVQTFCDAANGQEVAAGDYLSMATEVFLSGGKDPSTYGLIGFVYCKLPCFHEIVRQDQFVSVHTFLNR